MMHDQHKGVHPPTGDEGLVHSFRSHIGHQLIVAVQEVLFASPQVYVSGVLTSSSFFFLVSSCFLMTEPSIWVRPLSLASDTHPWHQCPFTSFCRCPVCCPCGICGV